MEELQVGEFIRTKSGELYKIDYVGESVVTAGEEIIIPLNYIENHSFELSNLVKRQDYVNGKCCIDIEEYVRDDGTTNINFVCLGGSVLAENIKRIVTSEKFASVEFNVEA